VNNATLLTKLIGFKISSLKKLRKKHLDLLHQNGWKKDEPNTFREMVANFVAESDKTINKNASKPFKKGQHPRFPPSLQVQQSSKIRKTHFSGSIHGSEFISDF